MHHTLRTGLSAIILLSALISNPLAAQDILSSTGVSTRSYNYVEVEYLTNVSQDAPFLINGFLDISRGFAISGRYTNQSAQLNLVSDDLEISTDQFTLGLLYRNQLLGLSNTDWFAEVGIGRLQVQIDSNAIRATQGVNLFRLSGGLRRTITERLEVELATNFLLTQSDGFVNEVQDLTVSARGVYRVGKNFDVALSLIEVPNANLVGLGFRFTWQ